MFRATGSKEFATGNYLNGLILFFAFLFSSCEPEIPNLTSAERKMADSLYRNEMRVFRKNLDSLCLAKKDSLLPIYVDSMKKERIIEIEKQLERIRKMK